MTTPKGSMIIVVIGIILFAIVMLITPYIGNKNYAAPDLTPLQRQKVCVIEAGGNGVCKVDITAEYANKSTDETRECAPWDIYYETTRYICVRDIKDTTNPHYLIRDGNEVITTWFTQIDGNTYIANSRDLPNIKINHLYYTVALTQAGYCHGPSKIISVKELAESCDGGSNCYGIPMGWINGSRKESCDTK
jgi:hypothetical protein